MGYTTDFDGEFTLDKPLDAVQASYLKKLAETRRMKRDPAIAVTLPDPVRKAVGLPIGDEAGYFVGGEDFMGQEKDKSVLDYNKPPTGQPGLWLQWEPSDDGTAIVWNEAEKFYDYTAWLKYLIDNFLAPWGYTLNGEVEWQGEDSEDKGILGVKDNKVYVKEGMVTYGEPKFV
jgi:hypothetical protein